MKYLLPLAGLMFAYQANAVELTGNFIPRGYYGTTCDPYDVPMDFIYSSTYGKRAVPQQCAVVSSVNPVFFWTKPPGLPVTHPMTLTLKGAILNPDTGHYEAYSFSRETTTPRMLFPEKLRNGEYRWQVSYVENGVMKTSAERRFKVISTNEIPQAADVVARVMSHARPRSLPVGSTHAGIYQTIQAGELKPNFASTEWLTNRYATHYKDPNTGGLDYSIPPAPLPKTIADFDNDGARWNAYKGSLRTLAVSERQGIELLGSMYFFTGKTDYLVDCKNRLISLAKWDASEEGPTSEKNQDQANREIFLTLAIGLDIFQSASIPAAYRLTDGERDAIVAMLKYRLKQSQDKLQDTGIHPYYSHVLTAAHYATEALMYAAGTPGFDEADELLASAWSDLITTSGAWGGMNDGGYGNSTSYGWYSLNVAARTVAMIKLISGYDMTAFAPMGEIGMNAIAQTPPGKVALMGAFGDGVETRELFNDHARFDFRLLAYATNKPEYAWYWRSYAPFANSTGVLHPYHFLLTANGMPAVPDASLKIKNSFLFEDAGYVAFHSDTKRSDRSSLFFRSSQLGSENHSHADNNAFVFVSKGKEVLISGGFYDYYNSPHHDSWTRQTRSKNALTFDGGIGQSEWTDRPDDINGVKRQAGHIYQSTDANGKLVNFQDKDGWMIATGDATNAYRSYTGSNNTWTPLLQAAYRTVVYSKADGVAIIYDYAKSATPRQWELNFQTLVDPNAGRGRLRIERENVATCVQMHGPASEFGPTVKNFAIAGVKQPAAIPFDEYSTRWHTLYKTPEFAAVTIINEGCGVNVTQANVTPTAIQVTVNGKTITFDKKNVKY